MRVLLDECVPRPLGRLIVGHTVETVQRMGWAGIKNGALLALMAERFDVFLTSDQNIPYQQNLTNLPVALVILVAPSNRLDVLEPLVPQLLAILPSLQQGSVTSVGKSPTSLS